MVSLRFLALVSFLTASESFMAPSSNNVARDTALAATADDRRSFLGSASAAAASLLVSSPALAAQEAEYRQGIEVTAFNGLIFNYRGGDFGGLDASTLNEPSIPYVEFCEKLKAGDVAFVEFMAPDGDPAYVTFKQKEGQDKVADPIRIGEGYPTEQHDGYSSPMFVVRTVKNFGVPYKFTVPGLEKYRS